MNISPTDPVIEHFRLTALQKLALKKLGITTTRDLLYHFPVRYGDTAEAYNIETLDRGDTAVIYGRISDLKVSKGFRSKIPMAEATIQDETGKIRSVWFNQPYLAKMIPEGALVRVEGKVSERRKNTKNSLDMSPNTPSMSNASAAPTFTSDTSRSEPSRRGVPGSRSERVGGEGGGGRHLYFSNPKIEVVSKLPTGVGDSLFGSDGEAHNLYPIYPESRGITSSWLYHNMSKLFKSGLLDNIPDPIPPDILEKYHLPGIKTAFIWIHAPMKRDDAVAARKRFSFEEIFLIQLGKQQARREYEESPTFEFDYNMRGVDEFIKRFPFVATEAQRRSIDTILKDMNDGHAMARLLEGDVGSGKTAVAATVAYAVVTGRGAPQKPTLPPLPLPTRSLRETALPLREVSLREVSRGARAANSVFAASDALRLQVAYMCPTEILATQHFESFIQYFSYLGVQIGLITSSGCRKFPSKVNPKGWTDISRTQLLKWVANGEIPIVIGTHALIQKSVQFKKLAFVIIDEQHRFGTAQRAQLVRKNRPFEAGAEQNFHLPPALPTLRGARPPGGAAQSRVANVSGGPGANENFVPHLLSMTATPIPRTLALTMYGDLDLTLLDQSPAGRKPIVTEIVLPNRRDAVYEKVRQELRAGRQMYVICTRIDEPDPDKELALYAKSVKAEAKRLKEKVFPEYDIGILHSRMKPKEKDTVMRHFKNGDIDILCATSVVEVGVNVPNATVILIEGAERFGLAQLHQLRGRVLRSSHQAYCYAFAETGSEKSLRRLQALATAKNGFELAELDLAERGAGALGGNRQWGVSDVAMEALKNLKMVEAAREEARGLIEKDRTLADYPILKEEVVAKKKGLHFE